MSVVSRLTRFGVQRIGAKKPLRPSPLPQRNGPSPWGAKLEPVSLESPSYARVRLGALPKLALDFVFSRSSTIRRVSG